MYTYVYIYIYIHTHVYTYIYIYIYRLLHENSLKKKQITTCAAENWCICGCTSPTARVWGSHCLTHCDAKTHRVV